MNLRIAEELGVRQQLRAIEIHVDDVGVRVEQTLASVAKFQPVSGSQGDPVDDTDTKILQAIVWRVGMRRHGHPGESMCPHRCVNLRPDLLPIIAVGRNKAAKRE